MTIPKAEIQPWFDSLEFKLRRVHGQAFEDFFADLMEAHHAEDFVRVAASGRAGDRKCDGYLQSQASIYQCYGAHNGGARTVAVNAHLARKMETDYKGASAHWTDMKSWFMVHNFVDGVSAESLRTLQKLQSANAHHSLAFFGKQSFEKVLAELDEPVVERLVGRAATQLDFANLQPPEVRQVIALLIEATEAEPNTERVSTVSFDKLEHNGLSGAISRQIEMGHPNDKIMKRHIVGHIDPLFGNRLEAEFRRRYLNLEAQGLTANEIMMGLYVGIVGPGTVDPNLHVAAWSLLSYLFHQCTILKDKPTAIAVAK